MIKLSVMCVQPLQLDVNSFDSVLVNNKNIKKFFNAGMNVLPSINWIDTFKKTHLRNKSFKSILSSKMTNIKNCQLEQDLNNKQFWVNSEHNIAENLQTNLSKFDLIFDYRLYSFMLVLELTFEFQEELLLKLLKTDERDNDRDNFYNTIRSLMVKENDESEISSWGSNVIEQAKSKAIECLKLVDSKQNHKVEVLNNTGNITFFYEADAKNEALKKAILNCNAQAERLSYNLTNLLENDKVSYHFFSRFHSIISLDTSYYHRFFPIQYHIQYMWFSVAYFIDLMDELNRRILINNLSKNINKNRIIIDEYINKFELLRIHNQDMKSQFESDNDEVYVPMESKWNICSSLDNAQSYVTSFKEYLERSYQRKMEHSNAKQNKILFLISCIQLMGLVSIWSDYLSLSKVQHFIYTTGMHENSQEEVILGVNTWFPIILLVGLIVTMVYTHFKHRS
ncbi:hypothetical protein [Shewanella sp. MBTL60-007]|uniref:hypothetical protein n=1 Tax=Shewanella sp. MBTL60-007 TaxID=2815911 RepID=UPI001BBF4EE5|nr:hypothetical protein [Shewanella sp. MBTL60-007]GIU17873.1 hypothetical protein TUM3792_13290 [Shewanella sp. MBTL60-007]